MKRTLTLSPKALVVTLCPFATMAVTQAQVSSYTFGQSSGKYTAITGGTGRAPV